MPIADPAARHDGLAGPWLALATDGPIVGACVLAGATARRTADPSELAELLDTLRPRVVLVGSPPAGPAELDLVATERRRRSSMRAVLVDAPDASDERLEALSLGFDEALPDTIAVSELLGRTRLLLRPGSRHLAARPGASIPLGLDLELDLSGQALRRGSQAIHLRPKEYRLLALLATHPGRVFSRRQLLDRVWGPGHEADPRTVDVHIRWLRSKVEADPERPERLVTVRGTGYRLDP